ncbi:MAG: hypothetical protein JXR78_15660 [Victivallales bacterium]|nr:hypothetical protein [Victivallales bacterium]
MIHEIEFWDGDGCIRSSVVNNDNGWRINGSRAWHDDFKLGFSWEISKTHDMTELRIPRSSISEEGICKFRAILPDASRASGKEGDGSSLVLPFEQGMLCECTGKPEAEMSLPLFSSWPSHGNMSLYGICGNGRALVMIMEDGRFDADFRIRTCFGSDKLYSIAARFWLRDHVDEPLNAEDLVLIYKELDGSWQEMATFYRDYVLERRGILTLEQKLKDNPTLRYSAQALTVRMRMCVKQMPTPVPEQTPETQPPMTVFLSFGMVENIIREFQRQQVEPCEFNLVGWNYGGHDGAFPQLFPVEERIGGEGGLKRLIDTAQKAGYPISLHDNYFDGYTLADTFKKEYVNRNHDQSLTLGGRYGGGQAYQLCPRCAYENYVEKNLKEVSELGISGVYYIDVISIAQLTRCYSLEHPLTRRENALWWKKMMRSCQDIFGGSMSEGAREWALPELDRAYLVGLCMDKKGLYITDEKDVQTNYFDQEIPLFQIVYHGSLIYNSFRDGINSFPGEDIYLRNIAYGGMPIYYYHHLFNPEWSNGVGWSTDLRYTTPENMKKDIEKIKRASDDVARLAHLQTCFIEGFTSHSPTLTETRYSDGGSVWVNYSDSVASTASGAEIPAHDFIVEKV